MPGEIIMPLLKPSKNADTPPSHGLPSTLSEETIEAMIERAARRGAKQALQEVGLEGEDAPHDIHELRSLLQALRLVRRTVCQTFARVMTTAVLVALLAGLVLIIKLKH
jgi:2-iminoacetate synthase ThiH